MMRRSICLFLLLILPAVLADHHGEEQLAEALLGKYDADTNKNLNEDELVVMIKASKLTDESFSGLPHEDHAHDEGDAHSVEDELAEALLTKYDADKNLMLDEAELIVMITDNTLTTNSFSALPADPHANHDDHAGHAVEEALADALLGKYDADNDKNLNEDELVAVIKASKLTDESFSGLPHDDHAHAEGDAHSVEDELAEALLTKYDTDKNDKLTEAELIEMIEDNKLATTSFSALTPTMGETSIAAARAGSTVAVAAMLAIACLMLW